MPLYEVWRNTTVKEMVEIEADTLQDAIDYVLDDPDSFDWEFIDADSYISAEEEED